METTIKSKEGPSWMVGHSFHADGCPRNIHEINGRHLVTLHLCSCGGGFRWHLDIQPELGRAPPPYSIGPLNPVTTQDVCQLGEMHFWHDLASIFWVHHWWVRCACGPSQDTIHSEFSNPNHSNKASQLSRSCQFLPQLRVGVPSYHLAFKSSHQGQSESNFFLF